MPLDRLGPILIDVHDVAPTALAFEKRLPVQYFDGSLRRELVVTVAACSIAYPDDRHLNALASAHVQRLGGGGKRFEQLIARLFGIAQFEFAFGTVTLDLADLIVDFGRLCVEFALCLLVFGALLLRRLHVLENCFFAVTHLAGEIADFVVQRAVFTRVGDLVQPR